MSFKQMKERCPTSVFLSRAFIENYKFQYDGHSDKREGAVGNIVECKGERVWGALWSIDKNDKNKLDEFEGVSKGLYRKEILRVGIDNGEAVEAFVYLSVLHPLCQALN